MFDANMRCVPVGKMFFAEVYVAGDEGEVKEYGIQNGDLILCEKLTHYDWNMTIEEESQVKALVYLENGVKFEVSNQYAGKKGSDWLVYAGSYDGTGFINEEVRESAMKLKEELGE